jgi:putative membrane protein
MKHVFHSRLILSLAVAAFAAAACSKRTDNAIDTTTASGSVALPDTTPSPPALPTTDGGIVEVLKTADSGEVAAAELARTKAKNAEVKSFARLMITDHGNDLKHINQMRVVDSAAAAMPEMSPLVTDMKSKHDAAMMDLNGLSGAEFDRVYMDKMVAGHQEVLGLLRQLQTRAQSADLQTHLTAVVGVVEKHLERAREVQSKLASDTTRTG